MPRDYVMGLVGAGMVVFLLQGVRLPAWALDPNSSSLLLFASVPVAIVAWAASFAISLRIASRQDA